MPGEPFLLRKADVEGTRRHNGVRAKLYGERSFHSGTKKVPAEAAFCKRVFNVLNTAYPGHAWSVEADFDNGVCKISIPPLLGFTWGYILHLSTMDKKAIERGGGEILERFKIPRSSIDIAAYAEARKTVPMIGNYRANHRRLIPA